MPDIYYVVAVGILYSITVPYAILRLVGCNEGANEFLFDCMCPFVFMWKLLFMAVSVVVVFPILCVLCAVGSFLMWTFGIDSNFLEDMRYVQTHPDSDL